MLFSLPLLLPNLVTFLLFQLQSCLGHTGLARFGVHLAWLGCGYGAALLLLRLLLIMRRPPLVVKRACRQQGNLFLGFGLLIAGSSSGA